MGGLAQRLQRRRLGTHVREEVCHSAIARKGAATDGHDPGETAERPTRPRQRRKDDERRATSGERHDRTRGPRVVSERRDSAAEREHGEGDDKLGRCERARAGRRGDVDANRGEELGLREACEHVSKRAREQESKGVREQGSKGARERAGESERVSERVGERGGTIRSERMKENYNRDLYMTPLKETYYS